MRNYILVTEDMTGLRFKVPLDHIGTIADSLYDGAILTLVDGQQMFISQQVDDLFDENGQPKVKRK